MSAADLRSLAEGVRADAELLADDLEMLADEWPAPTPPSLPPRLPDVRHIFDHGGEWGTRAEWQKALNRAPMRRSMWTVASSIKAQEDWIKGFVDDVLKDDGKTVYVVGVSPFPAGVYDLTILRTSYAYIGNQLARLPAAARSRVFLRFGWEPNGDWYPHSFSAKGQPADPNRIARYVTAWEMFGASVPDDVSLVLNFSGEGARTDPALFQRIAEEVAPDVVSVDTYPMWGNRTSWQAQEDCFAVARAVARHLDVPWAVDEWSPFVDKVTGGVQRGNLDGKVAVESMLGAYHYVQQSRLDNDSPLWVQMFERVSAEGKFAVVSVQATSVSGPIPANTYRSAGGAVRTSYAPRCAQVVVTLLGNPA